MGSQIIGYGSVETIEKQIISLLFSRALMAKMALQEMPVHRALQALKVYKVVPEMMEILVT
jgi:hypothetical protein